MMELHPNVRFPATPRGFSSSGVRAIRYDMWGLYSTVVRVHLLADLLAKGNLDIGIWFELSLDDVALLHVRSRSMLDHVANVIRSIISDRGKVPDAGFGKLRKWVAAKDSNAAVLGTDLAEAITTCAWYDNLVEVRDGLIHFGWEAIAIPPSTETRLLAQVRDGHTTRIEAPAEVWSGDRYVDFQRYAGLLIAQVSEFTERVGLVAHEVLGLELPDTRFRAKTRHHGINMVRTWQQELLVHVAATGTPGGLT
jgi:hypothetical protein